MTLNRRQLTSTLLQFYQHPVAQVSLELFLSIGAVIFFALFAIRPTLLTMSDLIKEIEDKRKLDQQLNQKIVALSSAQTEYLSLEPQLAVLDEAIPTSPQLLESLKILEKVASERRLVISTMSVSEIPDETAVTNPDRTLSRQTIAVKLIVEGEYLQIRQFIEDLRNTRRVFVVESVTFSTGEERGFKKLSAVLTIGIPYFGEAGGKK